METQYIRSVQKVYIVEWIAAHRPHMRQESTLAVRIHAQFHMRKAVQVQLNVMQVE